MSVRKIKDAPIGSENRSHKNFRKYLTYLSIHGPKLKLPNQHPFMGKIFWNKITKFDFFIKNK